MPRFDDTFSGNAGFVNEFIQREGTDLQISYNSGGTYDKKTLTKSGETLISYTFKGSSPINVKLEDVNGTTIRMGDFTFIVPAVQVTEKPPQGATIDWNSEKWSIENVDTMSSGDEIAAYKIVVRRI